MYAYVYPKDLTCRSHLYVWFHLNLCFYELVIASAGSFVYLHPRDVEL